MRAIDADQLKANMQKHKDFYVNAWGGFSNMPLNDKARTDELNMVIGEIINAPTVEPCYQTTSCLDCKNYDKENHNCPRFCEVIRSAVEEVKKNDR